MKLIAILSWFDESVPWLAATTASLARAGVSHLVAVDGAYSLYPEGRAHSGMDQHAVIAETARACGIGCTLHAPAQVWAGNEVEKRSFAFALAEQIAEPEVDWYFVMDADQIVSRSEGLLAELEGSDLNVAQVRFFEHQDPLANPKTAAFVQKMDYPRTHSFTLRCLFRAQPGLTLESNHYTYLVPGAKLKLWANEGEGLEQEPALDLSASVHVEHRTRQRDLARKESQRGYYRMRDNLGIERSNCSSCGERATCSVPTDFELAPDELGVEGLVAGWAQACEDCKPLIEAENAKTIRAHGYDPAELSVDLARPVS